ncbi:CPBP family intramembrane glutamic endopeptidase [Actinomycetospora aeridis]|uniref:CPBP family intramembrane glutamic endopeptidase n=1 Tax=Actinomycetospora aeridis TaxID=3129231 RepID=A0ABU8N836_9PSEU
MTLIRRHPLVTFFALTYVIAWAFLPFGSFGAFAPLVAALVVVPVTQGVAGLRELGRRLVRWRVPWWCWALAIAVPLAVHVLAAVLGDPSPLLVASWGDVLLVFLLRLVDPTDGALGEEPGWRGFALPGMQARLSPLAATAILAVLITVWHLPLVLLAEGDRATTLIGMIVGTVGVTFWYSWLFDHTGGSVLLVVVAHAVEGAIQDDTVLYFTLWLALAVVLVVVDLKAWLGRAPTAATTDLSRARTGVLR